MKVIINADDFGKDNSVNDAIDYLFLKNKITNATIMTNMPAYEKAVELSKNNGYFNRIGLHLNFFEGEPLTQKIKNDKIFIEGGQLTSFNIFHKYGILYKLVLPKKTRIGLMDECEAQIKKYLASGFTEMHIDSHGHSHTIPSIYFSIHKLLKKYGFISIRKTLKVNKINFLKSIYKFLFNYFMIIKFRKIDYFFLLRNI